MALTDFRRKINERTRRLNAANEVTSAAWHVKKKYGGRSPEYKRAKAIERKAWEAVPRRRWFG